MPSATACTPSLCWTRPPRGWIAPLLLLLVSQGVWGQGYEVRKLVMTGDEVPGDTAVTERFAYFDEVHLFEDGEVAFGGITTRTGYVFRNGPRGIYLSNTSGTLSVIAEIDDAEAWKSIGIPYHGMDSDDSKTFAFDYLHPTETALLPVLAKKAWGEELVRFNPDDGSSMLVSSAALPEMTFYEGTFLELGSPMLNALQTLLFGGVFKFTGDPENDRHGYFLASEATGIRNIVFVGDAAPGFSEAIIGSLDSAVLANNGNVFLKATLSGAEVSSSDSEILWMEDEGAFAEILREGSAAPGLPGMDIRLTALNMHVSAIHADNLIVFAGASTPAGSLHRVFWHAATDGTGLAPIVHYYNSPILEVPEFFTATEEGAVAFTSVDANAILLDDSGNVYFSGAGQFADGTDIGGIWKYEASRGSLGLLEPITLAPGGLYLFYLLSANNVGGVAFFARDYATGVRGIWTRSPSGELSNLATVGAVVEERPITGFALHSGTTTLGAPLRFSQLNDHGDFVFVATFADTGEDDDSHLDEAILLAAAIPPPTERYLWNGEAGDDDWHKVLNWSDLDQGFPATRIPGDEPGNEEVEIPGQRVSVEDRAVHLMNISATGALTINQGLTLEDDSAIENLSLNADLTTNGELLLTGTDNRWTSGELQGTGRVILDSGDTLDLAPSGGSLTARNLLQMDGTLNHHESHLNLSGAGSMVRVGITGFYEMDGGSVTDDRDGVHFENGGIFSKNGPGTARIAAFFENRPEGIVNLVEGILEFTDPSHWAGYLVVKAAGTAILDLSPVLLGTAAGDGFVASGLTLSNAGLIRFSGSEVLVSADNTAIFNLGGGAGAVELTEGAHFYGNGQVVNQGNFRIMNGLVETDILNEGEFRLEGPDAKLETAVENNERLVLDGAGSLGKLPGGQWEFRNNRDADLIKRGSGNFDIFHTTVSEGDIRVEQGSLTFMHDAEFGYGGEGSSQTLWLYAGAQCILGQNGDGVIDFLANTHTVQGNEGSGFTIDANTVNLKQGSRLHLTTDTHWKRGALFQGSSASLEAPSIEVGSRSRPTTFLIDNPDAGSGSEPALVLGDSDSFPFFLHVMPLSKITQNSDMDLSGYVHVSGLYELRGASILSDGFHHNKLIIDVGAGLEVAGVCTIGADTVFTGVDLEVRPLANVFVLPDSLLNVFSLEALGAVGDGTSILEKGLWTLGDNASVNIPSVQISALGQAALYLNPGSTFANLPVVPSDFTSKGILGLSGIHLDIAGVGRNEAPAVMILHGATVEVGTSLNNYGTIKGTGNIKGFVSNHGTMAPGWSAGRLTIDGDYAHGGDAELVLELGGTEPGVDYDEFVVNGTLNLGGSLRLICLDDSFPADGTAFIPISATDIVGDFEQIIIELPSSRQVFDVTVGETGVVAQAKSLVVPSFGDWREGVFTASELADETVSGPAANPDGDDYANLLEYVFDTNPKLLSQPAVSFSYDYRPSGGVEAILLEFPWANDVTDASFKLQSSPDLDTWTDLPSSVVSAEDLGTVTRTGLRATLPEGDAGFVRLVVEMPQ